MANISLRFIACGMLLLTVLFFMGCATNGYQKTDGKRELVIYTYDSFASQYGLGRVIVPKFEKVCNCTVKVVADGDVGWMVSRLIFEKADPQADVALGIDNTFKSKIAGEGLFDEYIAAGSDKIAKDAKERDPTLTPFDYGYIAIMYDTKNLQDPPKSLEDLANARYAKMLSVPDARTSSAGLAFLYWIASEYKNATPDYLKRLKPNMLAVTPGWSGSYALFTNGEAPLTISYTTSQSYHIAFENTTRYMAVKTPTGYRQVEYAAVIKGAKNPELARQFVDFMLTKDVQLEIPLGNSMYPAIAGTPLPPSFDNLPVPDTIYPDISDDKWLTYWDVALQ